MLRMEPTGTRLAIQTRQRMNSLGVPLREVSRRSGIALTTLHRKLIPGNGGLLTVREVDALAEALGTTPLDLLSNTPPLPLPPQPAPCSHPARQGCRCPLGHGFTVPQGVR